MHWENKQNSGRETESTAITAVEVWTLYLSTHIVVSVLNQLK